MCVWERGSGAQFKWKRWRVQVLPVGGGSGGTSINWTRLCEDGSQACVGKFGVGLPNFFMVKIELESRLNLEETGL